MASCWRSMMSSEKTDRIGDLLNQLTPHIKGVALGSLKTYNYFRLTVRAAIVKAFEFTLFTRADSEQPFFSMSTLRGQCDDLINLTYLARRPDRNDIVDRHLNEY